MLCGCRVWLKRWSAHLSAGFCQAEGTLIKGFEKRLLESFLTARGGSGTPETPVKAKVVSPLAF